MPLLDHFRPPLSVRRHWHSFHNAWATSIASELNSRLPEGYFAEPNVQFGIEIEAAFEEAGSRGVGLATGWTPPNPSSTTPLSIVTDSVEVLIFESGDSPVLVGAIELVSPANKDRPSHRKAFVSKCETYLNGGLGVVVVDIVTVRAGSLHDELMTRPRAINETILGDLYAAAYRPVLGGLDIWHEPIALGSVLPVLSLWLKSGPCVPVNLAGTYISTRYGLRMADDA